MTTQQDVLAVGSSMEVGEGLRGVEDHIAQDWDLWSRSLGNFIMPMLAELAEEVPQIQAAIFCSADGLNLCTLGVREGDVGRLSALTSSVFTVAAAHRKVVTPETSDAMTVHISAGDDHTVLYAVELVGVGQFVLGAYAEEIPLGKLLVEIRRTADRVVERLSISPP